MLLEPVNPPTAEPLTLQEVRVHLRQAVDDPSALENFDLDSGDDSWVSAKITAARELAEDFLGYPLTDALYVQTAAAFGSSVTLPVLAKQIVRIEYLDDADATQTLSPSIYYYDPYGGEVWFYGALPVLSTRPNAVRIFYKAGPAGAVPESIKHAMLITITDWHENRAETDKLPLAAVNLLRPKRLALGMA
jgi:uncharacterized phiE125 gp8 family phage protein